MAAVGIDLGTSTSAVAVYRRGRVETLKIDGLSVMPSCVAVKAGGGGLLVGQQAKKRALLDPQQTVVAIKREMGNRDFRVQLDGRQYSPVDISAMILQKLVSAASEQLGEAVKDAVISVPAYFTNNQKEDTRLAGQQAGINVLRLVPEPTAAAIAYGVDKGRNQTILVYDLGGGTFDVSVLQVKGNSFDVIAIGGAHDLGGEDFDYRMIDLILTELRRDPRASKGLAKIDAAHMQQQLKEAAEAAKKELSSAESAEIQIADILPGELFHLTVTRAQYETVIAALSERTIQITLQTLKDAGLSADDADRVVMVGGATRVPILQKTIAQHIRDPYVADNLDEVVSHGAALVAANLSAVVADVPPPVEVGNITAHSLGIRAAGDKFSAVIPRGTSLPAEAWKTFTTACDNADRTDVVVFQGEDPLCSNNQQIGGFALTGISRAPAGKPQIDVHFTVDDDDVLTVTARDRGTGRDSNVRIEPFEPQPYEPEAEVSGRDLKSMRIGVSRAGCDDAAAVITAMGLRSTTLKHQEFRDKKRLSQFDLIFINCLADPTQCLGGGVMLNPKKNAPALQEFVDNGGILYVSDYALDNITEAFPGHMTFKEKGAGRKGNATATVVDTELQQFVGASCPINFNTIYAPVASIGPDCRVYLARGNEPLLVSFPHGNGHVVYTSFHNGVQVSEKEKKLLMFIILQTLSLATSTPLVELAEQTHIQAAR
jgi:molecular chaperone DnaK